MPIDKIARYEVTSLNVLDEEGAVDPTLEPDLDNEALIELYRAMRYARVADERMLKLQRQGRIGTFAPSSGQEAIACGATFAMKKTDWWSGAFRELGGRLLRGEPLANYLLFHNGYEEGNVWRDTPPEERRTLPYSVIVAGQTLHAVGIAWQIKYRQEEDTAVVCFFGDGATSEGDFHEALNFASVWQLPVVFIAQNNQWAISVPLAKQTHSRTLAQKAIAYDMPGVQVDGNDALAVYRATREALDRAYAGGGPTLIEALTYRLTMHTTSDDPTRYRDEAEVASWREKDPLLRFDRYLRKKKLWDDGRQSALDAELGAAVEEAVQEMEARQGFPPDAPFDHVFGTRHELIEAQREEMLREIQRDRDERGGGGDV